MVPQILTVDQKQCRLHISFDLLHNTEMFDSIIASDETWCFQYELETKRKSMQWQTEFTLAEKSTHVLLTVQVNACVILRPQVDSSL
jgi:hypothetical protein